MAGGRKKAELTPEQVKELETLGAVLSVEQCADYFGMHRKTFSEIINNRQPEAMRAYRKGKSKAIKNIANGLLRKALDGDSTATMFYLKTQAGWRETQKIDHSSSDGSMSPKETTIEVSKLSDDVLEALVNASKAEQS